MKTGSESSTFSESVESCFSDPKVFESIRREVKPILSSNFSSPNPLPESRVSSYSARSSNSDDDTLAFTSDCSDLSDSASEGRLESDCSESSSESE